MEAMDLSIVGVAGLDRTLKQHTNADGTKVVALELPDGRMVRLGISVQVQNPGSLEFKTITDAQLIRDLGHGFDTIVCLDSYFDFPNK